MNTIFISHSSKDNSIAAELNRHLEEQGHRSVFLDFDPELGIPPGRNWEHELYRQLRTCQAIIVLCSEHSMSSRWCFAEITHAKSLGKHVFPVKVGPCTIDPVLTSRQIIDLTENPEDAYHRLWQGLKVAGLDPNDSFDWDYSRSPYPGMMSFQKADAAVFFGREAEIQQALETLQRLRQFGGARMLLVLGASGSGKSSLVRAGLLPRLQRNTEHWLLVDPFRPQDHPLRELSIVLAGAFSVSGQKRDWKKICQQLEQVARRENDQGATILNDVALDLQIACKRRDATTLLVIDQAEELLTRSEEEKTASFLSLLRSALEAPTSRLMVIFTLRSDFLGDFQNLQSLLGFPLEHLPVGPMPTDHLARIIEGPARIAGIELEDGLTEAMVRDTENQDALPLLAFTLRELYEHYGDNKLIELYEYREKLGGLNGAVARAADAAFAASQLSTDQEETLQNALVSLARINEAGQFTRQPANWSDLPENVLGPLERFVQARLLTSRGEGEERLLEVAHEALFHSWGRLKIWLDENREFLLWRKRFKEARQKWLRTRAPLEGQDLNEAQGWRERRSEQFTLEENEYLDESILLARKRRRLRLGAFAGFFVFLITVALGGIILWQKAEKARTLAEQQAELAQRANYNVQLARASEHWKDNPSRALSFLKDTKYAPMSLRDFTWGFLYRLSNKTRMTLTGHTDSVTSVAFSPGGKILASSSWDNTIKLWDAATGNERNTLTGHGQDGRPSTVAFSPNGQILASDDWVTIKLWDMDTGQEAPPLTGHDGSISSVVFSPDGNTLASASWDTTIKLWQVATSKELRTLNGHTKAVYSVAFSPDGRTLASASKDKTIKLWEVATGQELRTLTIHNDEVSSVAFSSGGLTLGSASGRTIKLWDLYNDQLSATLNGHTNTVSSVVFSPDGRSLASASADGNIKLWDTATGEERITLSVDDGGVLSVVFSPDGKTLASASVGGNIKLWIAATGQEQTTITKHYQMVNSVVFSPDGKTLASASKDGTIKLWITASEQERTTLTGHTYGVTSAVFSPDGKTLASAGIDKTIKLWNMNTEQERTTLTGHMKSVNAVAFSPDGKALASASKDKTIKLWNMNTEQERTTLIGHTKSVNAVVFSPDGKTLASASDDRSIRLWDTTTGQERATLTGQHTARVSSLTFSPDGKTLISGSKDRNGNGAIKLWDAHP